jgi:hypothetical protein
MALAARPYRHRARDQRYETRVSADGQAVVSYQIDGSDFVKALAQDLSMQRSKSSAAQAA